MDCVDRIGRRSKGRESWKAPVPHVQSGRSRRSCSFPRRPRTRQARRKPGFPLEEIEDEHNEAYVVCALLSMAALCASTAAQAQSPFDGTWRTDLAKTSFSPKPIIFYISHDWYHCVSCTPSFDVAADGQDHAVAGQAYDTIAVTVVDDHTIKTITKKGGKIIGEQTRKVSDDGKILTVETTQHPMNSDKPATFETKAKRDGMLRIRMCTRPPAVGSS